MKTKSQLQKENELLKAKLLIKQHTKSYIHISFSWKGIGRFFAFLGSLGLAVANFLLIIYTWKLLKLGNLIEEDITGFHQLFIIYPLIGEYILIGLTVVCLVALFKDGFNKLKTYNQEGLIGGLIIGLIGGLIFGLIFGLISGLIIGLIIGLIGGLVFGLIVGLIDGLIGGLIAGLIFGLIIWLVFGLIAGLIYEFEN